jgi:2-amino-4-hydroxy-6-hydroxymethyldihydropteridine diphosphokinase
MNATPVLAVIALGSNLGESTSILQEAIGRLQSLSAQPLRVSSLWKTTPVDCPPGAPGFINAAVAFCPLSSETPESLLAKLQDLEREFGRRPKQVHNEARPLDLDLIVFGPEIRDTPTLTLPHPRAAQRKFVLAPLSEIVPDLVFPRCEHSVRDLMASLRSAEQIERIS